MGSGSGREGEGWGGSGVRSGHPVARSRVLKSSGFRDEVLGIRGEKRTHVPSLLLVQVLGVGLGLGVGGVECYVKRGLK